jgi:hypothetical protein
VSNNQVNQMFASMLFQRKGERLPG